MSSVPFVAEAAAELANAFSGQLLKPADVGYEEARRVHMLSKSLPADYQSLAGIVARLSLVWVNFGFWVGSLWGDYPLASWLYPESWSYSLTHRPDMLHIPEEVFAVVWAAALLVVGVWGARQNRRFVVNTAAVFGGIHFYTQWFEHLELSPKNVIIAGAIAIAASTALWRYNQLRTRLA